MYYIDHILNFINATDKGAALALIKNISIIGVFYG